MYSLELRDRNLDYTKRQILLAQENFKVFVPFLFVLTIGLLALNVANAMGNFMAVYVCVIVNLIGIGGICGLTLALIKANTRQRNLFAQLEQKSGSLGTDALELRYVSDTEGILKNAAAVRVTESESAYIVLPRLPDYRHALFTRYDFRGDFGRLTLPKGEYEAIEDESGLRFVSADTEFRFAPVKDIKNARKRAE